jgi:glycosyltransferase involved in cell wall biosynthesis
MNARIHPKRQQADVCVFVDGRVSSQRAASTLDHLLHAREVAHLNFAVTVLIESATPALLIAADAENLISVGSIQIDRIRRGAGWEPNANRISIAANQALVDLASESKHQVLLDLFCELKDLSPRIKTRLGANALLNNVASFNLMAKSIQANFPEADFVELLAQWRNFLRDLYQIGMAPIPKASAYMAFSGGMAPILGVRARSQYGRPLYVSVDQSADQLGKSLNSANTQRARFVGAEIVPRAKRRARINALRISDIISAPDANTENCLADSGVRTEKIALMPTAIDHGRFAAIERRADPRQPTICLMAELDPKNDIITFIRAMDVVRQSIPSMKAWVLGAVDVDTDYYRECKTLVRKLGLDTQFSFKGEASLEEYLPFVHINVVTSLTNEAVKNMLSVGAAGVPTVSVDTHETNEIIYGLPGDRATNGPGGAIASFGDPTSFGRCISRLLKDPAALQSASTAIRARVKSRYCLKDQEATFARLFDALITMPSKFVHEPSREAAM